MLSKTRFWSGAAIALIMLVLTFGIANAQTIDPIDPNGGGTLFVYVVADTDHDGKAEPSDAPLSNVSVLVEHAEGCLHNQADNHYYTTTTADGRITIDNAAYCYYITVVDFKMPPPSGFDLELVAPPEGVGSVAYVLYDFYNVYMPTALKQ